MLGDKIDVDHTARAYLRSQTSSSPFSSATGAPHVGDISCDHAGIARSRQHFANDLFDSCCENQPMTKSRRALVSAICSQVQASSS